MWTPSPLFVKKQHINPIKIAVLGFVNMCIKPGVMMWTCGLRIDWHVGLAHLLVFQQYINIMVYIVKQIPEKQHVDIYH